MLKLVKRTVGLLSLLHPLCAWNSHGQSLPIQSIPFAGNGYRMESAEHNSVQPVPSGKRNFLLSFCVDRDCEANLFAVADRRATLAPLRIWVENRLLKVKNSSAAGDRIPLGRVHLKRGYVRTWWSDSLSALEVQPFTPEVVFNYVRDNQDNRYYWGRRGPSVHLNYLLPKESNAEYFYQEVTVPNGMDPIGSYFMAAGFGEGYFGIQVNGPDERRILFSVWSPYKTDDPGAIPENEKIRLIAKGEGVYVGEFGHEGSGGQSYLRYPWKAGQKYCFLLRGKPDGKGSTLFSAWFKPFGAAEWRLVATFSRPQTDHCLTRLHAFLENFEDHQGYLTRKALYSHACYREISGKWFPLTSVRFTGDDIARRGYRLDFDGGVEGDGFYLQNGGFFNPTGKALPSLFQLLDGSEPLGNPPTDLP